MLELALVGALGVAALFGLVGLVDDDDGSGGGFGSNPEDGERIEGDETGENLSGTRLDDLIFAQGGNDIVAGGGGDDRLFGQDGNDALSGGPGDDLIRGGDGTDVLFGRDGADDLRGDLGADWLDGGAGDDALNGGFGFDVVAGGDGADVVNGGGGNDVVIGAKSADFTLTNEELAALGEDFADGFDSIELDPDPVNTDTNGPRSDDEAPDMLFGGDGDDLLVAGAGDEATGGDGDDVFVLINDPGGDLTVINDFENGADQLVYLYNEAEGEPVLSLEDNADGSQTLLAEEQELATVINAQLTLRDIMLLPRNPVST